MYDTIMFDLDGTLLPIDEDRFIKLYFSGLASFGARIGIDSKLFLEALNGGVKAMLGNDGARTNKIRFWDHFCASVGLVQTLIEPVFLEYYLTDFKTVRETSRSNPLAKSLVRFLKSSNKRIVLATNPLFPSLATKERMSWIELEMADFCDVTTYENSSFSKPNILYFREIVERLRLDVSRTIMIGNDVTDDMIASDLGIDTYLVTDCLKNGTDVDLAKYRQGSFADLDRFLRQTT